MFNFNCAGKCGYKISFYKALMSQRTKNPVAAICNGCFEKLNIEQKNNLHRLYPIGVINNIYLLLK